METTLGKGQLVLPIALRRRLGLRAGDRLEAHADGDRIILTPRRKPARTGWPRIVNDAKWGGLVLSAGPGAPEPTSEQVRTIISKFL